jgi:hypothetical protein
MAGNMFIPPPQRPQNPMMGLLTQLALMKVQHDWSMDEKKLALEAAKVEKESAREEKKGELKFKAQTEGVQFTNPTGPIAGPEAYKQPEGSQYSPLFGQNVTPPNQKPQTMTIEGQKFYKDKDGWKPLKDDGESAKGPADIQKYELVTFGKSVPELRGTKEYQDGYMKFLMTTREQNPVLDWTSKQYEMQRQKEASGLRTEFNTLPEVKNYFDLQSKFSIMKDALDESRISKSNVATDQALITVFNKITDPQSVVRESEYARTASDLSMLNRLKGKVEKWQKGGAGLTDEDRQALVTMATKFNQASEKRYGNRLKEYRGYFTNIGMDANQYLTPYGSQEGVPGGVPTPSAAPAAGAPASNGKKIVRQGTEKGTGRKVIQYDDGTTKYAD